MRLNATRLVELAYIAGLFDGEGCVVIAKRVIARHRTPARHQYILMVSLTNTNRPILDRLKEMFGGVIVTAKHKKSHWLPCYTWSITARRGARFLRRIHRRVRIKSAQVDLALNFQATLDYSPWSPERDEWKESIKLQLAALKRV
jgi:hypothetical protein